MAANNSERNVTVLKTLFEKNLKTYFSFEIGFCNAHQPYSFQKAYIECPQFLNHRRDNVPAVQLHNLLSSAFQVLRPCEKYGIKVVRLPGTSDKLYRDQQAAVKILTDFIDNYENHEKSLNVAMREEQEPERAASVALGIHLLKGLALDSEVTINCRTGSGELCPCWCGMVLPGRNTGIGHKKVWHGFPDLLVNHTAVTVKKKTVDLDESSEKHFPFEDNGDIESATEQMNTLYGINISAQLISQAVTNGFAQRKKNNFVNCLIPTIGFTLNRMLIYLYDPDQDILVRRKERLELMDQNDNLILPAIVELWFILNQHLFGATMSEQICFKLNKSGLKSHLERYGGLDIYQESVLNGAGENELCEGRELDANVLASKHAFCFVDQ